MRLKAETSYFFMEELSGSKELLGKNCAPLKEYGTFQKSDTYTQNIQNIIMSIVLVTPFYIYEGLEPTEGGTNTITPFRGRFRPISIFEIFWQKIFSPEIWNL